MKVKNICIITDGYPSDKRIANTFVEQLTNEFADFNINCYVISPQSISRILVRGTIKSKRCYYRINENGKKVKIFSPFYITFSNIKKFINTNNFNLFFFKKE